MMGLKNIIRSMKGNRSLYSLLLLQTIIMIYISTISAETFQHPRNSSSEIQTDNLLPNNNTVKNYEDCKKYLCKYGYLSCDCKDGLSRQKRQLPTGVILREYDEDETEIDSSASSTSRTPPSTDSSGLKLPCTSQEYTAALKKFQKIYRLEVTGTCDERTTTQMSQRRCGQPDTVIDKLDSEIIEEEASRKPRSLTSIINSNIEMEQTIERRKQLLQHYIKEIEQEKLNPSSGKEKSRPKRSIITRSSNDYGAVLNKQRVSWRLMNDHLYQVITPTTQRSILRLAFRYWSEVTPLCFYEDENTQDIVDIEIGFLEGVHLSCYRQFDGFGGEIAHKFHRDVHFDNSEPYTENPASRDRISLLLVAVHELGHVLGLNHSKVADSVMNAIYHTSITGEFELSNHDRQEIYNTYGPCHGRFDTAFDLVRTKPGTKSYRIYTSYFFRNDHYWTYDNGEQRTRKGDPQIINAKWTGLPENIDTFLHYWEFDIGTLTFSGEEYLFFKGDRYYSYNPYLEAVQSYGRISSKFRPANSTTRIPSNLDASFYDHRAGVGLVYFFKGDKVYSYKYSSKGGHSCCVSIAQITDVFPPTRSSDLYAQDSGNSYGRDIDSVYFSNSNQKLYFIKGNDTWVNEPYPRTKTNSMKYVGKWNEIWKFICDGECS